MNFTSAYSSEEAAPLALAIDPVQPETVFRHVALRRGAAWLDSSRTSANHGRFSIVSAEPRRTFTSKGKMWCIRNGEHVIEQGIEDPLNRLQLFMECGRVAPHAGGPSLPFFGGLVGWFGYDLGRQFEILPNVSVDDLQVPDVWLGWYDNAIVWDHLENTTWLVGSGYGRTTADAIAAAYAWTTGRPPLIARPQPSPICARSNLSAGDYMAKVDVIRSAIARGELYQLNLVQRFECECPKDPAATYLKLREINPAPYSAYIDSGETLVLSSSPESFVDIAPSGAIRTCPIKGTRPRGGSDFEDSELKGELLHSQKERAELLMIVDLLRNDLGRICRPGSIAVDRLHSLESFSTVHHLVGEVRGQLRAGLSIRELLSALFPGGSITGAPKISAMRAIDMLEPHRRAIGMGSIGYLSNHGQIGLNIAIRTIICHGDRAYIPVGAGIVWDSVPELEYEETLAKARAQFAALGVTKIAT